MINYILDAFPKEVIINEYTYPIHFGFRSGIKMDIAYHDKRYTEKERIMNMLRIFYGSEYIPIDIEGAIEKMFWFYTRGQYELDKNKEEDKKGGLKSSLREFCFIQDSELILSAFFQFYKLDLTTISDEELHWWKFMAYFSGLPEDSLIQKYIYYRTCSLKGLSKEAKTNIKTIRYKIRVQEYVSECELSPAMKLEKRNSEMIERIQRIHFKVENELQRG